MANKETEIMTGLLKYCIEGVTKPFKVTIPGRTEWCDYRTHWMVFKDTRGEGPHWCAVGLDWSHVEQGTTLVKLMEAIEYALALEPVFAKECGCEPFQQTQQAKAWIDRWEKECEGDKTL